MKKYSSFYKTFSFSFFFLLFFYSVKSVGNNPSKNISENLKSKTSEWMHQNKAVGFQENKGQMSDAEGNPTPYVLFKAEAPGFNIWVTTTGLTYQFYNVIENEEKENHTKKELISKKHDEIKLEWKRVDMILKNASIKKENIIEEGDITQGKTDFYFGHCPEGIFDVKTHTKITIKNIYEGIDWVLYTTNSIAGPSLKQDFIVHPNANANQIKIIYEGGGKIHFSNNQIHFENEFGELQEGKLYCYQGNETNEIKSNYTIKENTSLSNLGAGNFQNSKTANTANLFSYEIAINTNEYNKNEILIIDPQMVWNTFAGSSLTDGFYDIECDVTGNVLIAAYAFSTNFPVLNLAGAFFQGTNAGRGDGLILKFTPAGVLQWASYYGGGGSVLGDGFTSICSDAAGNMFVTGYTEATNFPLFNPFGGAYYQAASGGGNEAFIIKFDVVGARQWATYYGDTQNDEGFSIKCDAAGDVFVSGGTDSPGFPTLNLPGAYNQLVIGGITDAFILRFSNIGVLKWATFFGGSNRESFLQSGFAASLCFDPTGNLYVVGSSMSGNLPIVNLPGAYNQAALSGGCDAYVLKINNAGVLLWSTYYGGNAIERGFSIESDKLGNIFITGYTGSPNLPLANPGAGAYSQAALSGGFYDAYITKFSNTGVLTWATYYGGNGEELFHSFDNISIDSCNNVYVSFNTSSTNMSTIATNCTADYNDPSFNAGLNNWDIFIIKFKNDGTRLWASYLGGGGDDFREGTAIDIFGNLYITGEVANLSGGGGYTFPNPGGAFMDSSFGGQDDSFISKFKPIVTFSPTQSNATGCGVCNGSASITLTCGSPGYNFVWSNGTQVINSSSNTSTISNLCPGSYTVTATSDCYATVTSVYTITGPSGGTISSSQNPTLCTGNSFVLPDGSSVSTSGTYVDTLLSYQGCDSIITTTLNIVSSITTSQAATICTGNSYSLPGGGTTTVSGVYKDTLTAIGGCDSIITTTLNVTPILTSSQSASICAGGSYSLPWGGSVTIAGAYKDTAQTAAGCDSVITINLIVNPLPTATAGNPLVLNCTNTSGTISVSTTAGASYSWVGTGITGGNTTATPTVNLPGTFTVTVTNLTTGCTATATVTVTSNTTVPNVTAGAPLNLTCTQSTGTISANSTTANTAYSWNGPGTITGNTINAPTVNTAGTYTVTVTDPTNGCTSTTTVNVTASPLPTAGASPNITILPGTSTTLTATGGGTYSWIPTTNLTPSTGATVVANPSVTTRYCVEVSDANGCKDTACVTVSVEEPCPIIANLGVPNAFSPNEDNINDEFCLQGWEPCIQTFNITIYDRWGEKVFESKDLNFCWDGKYKGIFMDPAVFVYIINATYKNNNSVVNKKGNISLIK